MSIADTLRAKALAFRKLYTSGRHFPQRSPSEITKATDVSLLERLGRLESLAATSVWLVIFGIAAEAGLAFAHPPYDSRAEEYSSVIANALIGLGVWLEFLFGRRGAAVQEELRRRADVQIAAANERAATLEKEAADAHLRLAEIERVATWRHITPQQQNDIVKVLHHLAPTIDLLVEFERGDTEAWSYGQELVDIFQAAGVQKIRFGPNSLIDVAFGAGLAAAPGTDGEFIAIAFSKSHVPITLFRKDLATHLPRNVPAPNLYIFVAPKPPPMAVTSLSESSESRTLK